MTQHIEEARKLEPVAYKTPYFENGRNGKLIHIYADAESTEAVKDEWEPLVRLSDAQAAIDAAEERGRIEERERHSVAAAKLDIAINAMWSTINTGCVWKLEDAIEEMNVIDMSIPRAAITKEPTP